MTPHARRFTSCEVCGEELRDGVHVTARRSSTSRPFTRAELVIAGWCAGVLSFAATELLARWLAS
jgi:hypothetical protein